jgi:hypothetical protein
VLRAELLGAAQVVYKSAIFARFLGIIPQPQQVEGWIVTNVNAALCVAGGCMLVSERRAAGMICASAA